MSRKQVPERIRKQKPVANRKLAPERIRRKRERKLDTGTDFSLKAVLVAAERKLEPKRQRSCGKRKQRPQVRNKSRKVVLNNAAFGRKKAI